jgi:hypothetical protein
MKLQTLENYESQFLEYCKQFYASNDRNKDWFNPDLPYSVVNRYKMYPLWTFLTEDDDSLIAMSCVQTHFFPENCARLLTRTYYHPDYRRKHFVYEREDETPATRMIDPQLEWAKQNNITNLFFSVEFIRRRSSLEQLAKKLNNKYKQNDWKVLDGLYQTYPSDDDLRSWQVVCSNQYSLPLKSISLEKWKETYGR